MLKKVKFLFLTLSVTTICATSCVSLRQYTELTQEKHATDSVNTRKIDSLECRLREVSASRLELLQDTLRLNRELRLVNRSYKQLLAGSTTESMTTVNRLKESRAKLNERNRMFEEQSERLNATQEQLDMSNSQLERLQAQLSAKQRTLGENTNKIAELESRINELTEQINSMQKRLNKYSTVAKELQNVRKDSIKTQIAIDMLQGI